MASDCPMHDSSKEYNKTNKQLLKHFDGMSSDPSDMHSVQRLHIYNELERTPSSQKELELSKN